MTADAHVPRGQAVRSPWFQVQAVQASKYIFIGVFAVFTALMAAYPVFPPLARQLGLSDVQTGALISLSALVMLVSSPLWGGVSDRWGRKRVFLIGLFGVALSLILFALAVAFGLSGALTGAVLFAALILTRVPLGLTAAAATVSAQAYVADTTDAENRSSGMAMIGAGNALGLIVGPALAAGLVLIGLLAPFYVAALLLILVALVTAYRMPVAPQIVPDMPVRLRPWDPRFRSYLLIGLCAVVTISILQITVGFLLLDRIGLSVADAAQVAAGAFFVAGLGLVLVQAVVIPKLKLPPGPLLRAGLPVMGLGCLLLVWAPEIWAVYGSFVIVAIGAGLAFPGYQAAVTLAAEEVEQGAVAGLTGAASAAGGIIGPFLGTVIYQIAPQTTYLVLAVMLAGLTVLVWRIRTSPGADRAGGPP